MERKNKTITGEIMKELTRKCWNCGAQMTYNKLRKVWFCELCGNSETIEDLKTTEELDFE